MRSPLLTILLPNRGRSNYLSITLQNLSEISDERVEVIILENSAPNQNLPDFDMNPAVFRVVKSPVKLSMTKNWCRGISLARGQWICYIGSDDGVVVGNLSKFLDFLELVETDVVSTHPIYFQYPILNRKSWADLPMSGLSTWSKKVRYVSLLAVIFPQLKLDLPVPYNRCVVKSNVLKNFAKAHDDIPGVSPDDFLGQYISQKCRFGTYLELPVFIQGGSERSNGYQVSANFKTQEAIDFVNDSTEKFGIGLQRFSVSCGYSLAFEHYSKARSALNRKMPKFATYISILYAEFFCPDYSHHSQSRALKIIRCLLQPSHMLSYRLIRKIVMISNFIFLHPIKNKKVIYSYQMDVLKLGRHIAETI